MIDSTTDKKAIMYAIIRSLESDFIQIFMTSLQMEDIPKMVLDKSNRVNEEANLLLSVLMGLDIQAFIEICNSNIEKLGISADQRRFLNIELAKIIPIRNKVMHPRPVEITDLPILQAVVCELPIILKQYAWKNLEVTFYLIENEPSRLQLPPLDSKKSDNIIENLPSVVDFEETSFVGRRKEIGEIKAKLNRKNVHVLSIIGDGGVGKTALALKMLYDMLDDTSCNFELILWVSLKTNELTGYEFKKIDSAIATTAQMYSKLGEFVGKKHHDDIPAYLIELAQNFETLFVLDNLETINSEDVKSFIDDFSEYGKVLITSRIGLGEMEHRYRLDGLNSPDVLEYMNILLEMYGFSGLLTEVQKLSIAEEQLHSNPLAIKWFVKSLYSGQTIDSILEHKENLILFCMSNVYDKLSDKARTVLDTILISKIDMSFGELIYYSESTLDDFVNISLAINELIKCNFLDDVKYRVNNLLSITHFASEFLQSRTYPNREKTIIIRDKGKNIATFIQSLEQKKITSPSANDTFFFYGRDKNRIIAAYYLTQAIQALNAKRPHDDILGYAKVAQKIAADYSECAVIMGLCYATSSPEKARIEFEHALQYCREDHERAIIQARYSRFLRSNNMYQEAVDRLENAISLCPSDYSIKFELIMSLCWINNFTRAKSIFDGIDSKSLTQSLQTEYAMRYADMLRRESEIYVHSSPTTSFQYLKEAFTILENISSNIERKFDAMANILRAMSYLYIDNNIIDYIIQKLELYYLQMRGTPKFKRFRESMVDKLAILSADRRKCVSQYLLDANILLTKLGKRQGLIVDVRDTFGFCKVMGYEQRVHFQISDLESKFEVGDVITYERITADIRGPIAINVKYYGKAIELLIQ